MHYTFPLILLALPLLSSAQSSPVAAIRNAKSEYTEILARLTGVRSDCVRNEIYPQDCNRLFAQVAKDITQANDQLDIAAENFVPKVPCTTIAAVFYEWLNALREIQLQSSITEINSRLRDIACESALATQAAAKANAPALRSAISDQIVKIDLVRPLFSVPSPIPSSLSLSLHLLPSPPPLSLPFPLPLFPPIPLHLLSPNPHPSPPNPIHPSDESPSPYNTTDPSTPARRHLRPQYRLQQPPKASRLATFQQRGRGAGRR
ncbi:MAG: hypothetical protein Q9204_003171 [Flavoplaca sp. TL-2023a]